jgi:spermidine/putrescine-binding protein
LKNDAMKIEMKVLWLVLIASLALTACGGEAPVTETPTDAPRVSSSGYLCPEPEFPLEVASTELNLFVWTEYVPADMMECFELVYGVDVNLDLYSTDGELYEKVAGGGNNYDLILPSDNIVLPLIRQGLLQELDHARLPVFKNFDPNYLDFEFDPGNRFTVPYLVGIDAIVVNTARVESVPQSWADLWKTEYAGRMVFLDDSRAVIGVALLALGYDVNTRDPAELEEAKAKLSQLIPSIKLFDSDSPKTALLAEAVDLGMTWTGEAFIARQENPQIEYIFPSEGAIIWQDNWAMLADAPNPEAAYAWLNYINQGNMFWMVLRDFPYIIPNVAALEFARENSLIVKDVKGKEVALSTLYADYMASPITNVSPEVIRTCHRIADVGEAAILYDNIWDEVRNGD